MRTPQALATTAAVETHDLTFSYEGHRALDGLSLTIATGSLLGLLGPNGSGKSTLLTILAGLRTPASGSVTVLGRTPDADLRTRVGFLFQETSLDPLMTVGETLSLHGRLYGMESTALRRRTSEVLAAVDLADRSQNFVRTLSGGMKRRLELARALLPRPELLLLDEPTTGLDPNSEHALWQHLLQINSEGVTVVLSTNKVGEADRHCDTVAFVHCGRVAAKGAPADLKTNLKHDAVWAEGEFSQAIVDRLRLLPGVGLLTWAPPLFHATVDSASTFVPLLFQESGGAITSVRLREASLEDAYFEIVGAALNSPEKTA